MTPRRYALGALAAVLALVLAACSSTPPPAALNGTYVGDLRDASVGYLGSHAMEVATTGTSFSGTYCFVATSGDAACNVVSGTVTGTSASGSVDFTVGAIRFWGSVANDREIRGNYAFADGRGSFDMSFDATAGTSSLTPFGTGSTLPAAVAFAEALEAH